MYNHLFVPLFQGVKSQVFGDGEKAWYEAIQAIHKATRSRKAIILSQDSSHQFSVGS